MNESSGLQAADGLRRVLGRWQLLCVGIGAIIGSGIFVIPGPAAAQFAGPGVVISFVIAALGCALAGLCYAELAAMFPAAGSAYAYSSRAFGRAAGWIVGWLLILEYLFAAAIVSQACAAYALSFFDVEHASYARLLMMILPLLVLAGVSCIAIRGVEQSASVVVAIVLVKVGVIVLVIAFGAAFVDTERWTPFVPENTGVWGEYGWSGVLRAAGIVFYTYLGFDTVSVAAQEARQPQRDVPFALLGSLILCTVLFVAMMLVVTGLVDYRALNVANPIAVAIDAAGEQLRWLAPVVEIGAMIGMVSVLVVILMAQARILFAMASDGLLPPALARLHPRWRTPAIGTLLTAAVAGLIAALIPVSVLGQMVSVGVLAAFIAVAIAVLVWRRRQPDVPRPFRVPAVPWVPIGAVLVCGYMAAGLPLATWWRFAAWLVVGGLVYALYGRNNRGMTT
ncbi:MAG TPA: amino acid permease [Steroidobacter sp.]